MSNVRNLLARLVSQAGPEVGFLGFGFYPRSGFIPVELAPARQWGEWLPVRETAFAAETPSARDVLADGRTMNGGGVAGVATVGAAGVEVAQSVVGEPGPPSCRSCRIWTRCEPGKRAGSASLKAPEAYLPPSTRFTFAMRLSRQSPASLVNGAPKGPETWRRGETRSKMGVKRKRQRQCSRVASAPQFGCCHVHAPAEPVRRPDCFLGCSQRGDTCGDQTATEASRLWGAIK